MNLEEAKTSLQKYRVLPIEEQTLHREEIIEAFRTLWNSNPSEKEFSDHLSGIVLFPEITYIMIKEGR